MSLLKNNRLSKSESGKKKKRDLSEQKVDHSKEEIGQTSRPGRNSGKRKEPTAAEAYRALLRVGEGPRKAATRGKEKS